MTVLESKTSLIADDIYECKQKKSGYLLSFTAARNLELIITPHLDLNENIINRNENKNSTGTKDDILKGYANVFRGLGKLKGSKVYLNIDDSITPVSLKQRRIPFHIWKKVDDAIDKLLKDDISEKVPNIEPTPWVSPIVAIPQKDDTIRLCLDMRKPDEAIKRTRFPIPTSKDLNILRKRSMLDIRQTFHQLELDDHSPCSRERHATPPFTEDKQTQLRNKILSYHLHINTKPFIELTSHFH